MADQIGVSNVDFDEVKWRTGKSFTQKNKGVRDRYKSEMGKSESDWISSEFPRLLELVENHKN